MNKFNEWREDVCRDGPTIVRHFLLAIIMSALLSVPIILILHMLRVTGVIADTFTVQKAYAGQDMGYWTITRYYTPVPGQRKYYNGWSKNPGQCSTKNLYYIEYENDKHLGDYKAEACMNGQGDIFDTADGTNLKNAKPLTIIACPPQYLGRTFHIQDVGYVVCHDTGGAIKGKHLDLWCGVGDEGYETIEKAPGGLLKVHLKP